MVDVHHTYRPDSSDSSRSYTFVTPVPVPVPEPGTSTVEESAVLPSIVIMLEYCVVSEELGTIVL